MEPIDTHCCLLSRQPLPNLLPLLDRQTRPRRVVFVVSAAMREQVEWLRAVLRGRDIEIDTWPIDDPWDFTHLQRRLLELLERERDALHGRRIALNATGGTKPMSIAAYDAFSAYKLPVFYVHPERDRLVWFQPQDRPPHELEDRLRLEPFLQAHGARVAHRVQRRPPRAEHLAAAAEMIEGIGRYQKAIGQLNWLAHRVDHGLRTTGRIPADHDLQTLIAHLQRHGLLLRRGDRLRFPDEASRFFVNGGWLETWVFETVRRARRRDPAIQDLARGVEVVRRERGRAIRNELDVVFLRNNRLYLIECKTSKFTGAGEDSPGAEALYKLDSLKELMGGLQARAMLVSYRKIAPAIRARAEDLGIVVCAGEQLAHLGDHIARFTA